MLRAPGRNADAVAELAVALLFAATRGVVPADRDVREGEIYRDGKIPYQRYRAWELAGRTVGLVGLGAVGRALRWRLRGLGMDVLAYDPYAPDATARCDELLARSDVISIHAPVTEETTGMIDADAFAKMRDGVVYLNTARAKIHDTDALVAALASGKVGAAGLDHFEGEHLATDHPLTTFPQVVLTPHIGGATYDTESNHTRTIAEDLCRLMAGRAAAAHREPRGARRTDVAARQPTIIATSIGFQPEGPDPMNLRPGPSYRLAADLARAGDHPRVCIIATAVGDDSARLAAAHNAFSKLGFISSHLHAVPDAERPRRARPPAGPGRDLGRRRQHRQPARAVAPARARRGPARVLGGGRGAQGVSAGSLCWHVGGTTDSFGPTLQPVTNGLAFLPYSNSPHHDAEEQRRPLDPPPHRRGHAARRLRHRERHRPRLLRHRAARRLHRGGGQGGLLAHQGGWRRPARWRSPTRLL